MADKVHKFGRIRYIDPNFSSKDSEYRTDKFDGTFNITQPYEDYCISVDLLVERPQRIKYGKTHDKSATVVNERSDSTISFFSGDGEHLTTSPGTTIYSDILNNKDTKESLGITNINITYNSYFYPEVTIKFTDIRGGALMMPHEELYRQELRNNYLEATGQKTESFNKINNFFSALFHFPYPEFKLRVKGFYGKKVEYSLVVEDFKSSFNNETGNFDATVKFIGKMYGVYTDIPMSYLLIAPYCRYGADTNQTMWEKLDLRFDDNIRIPTFMELQEKILLINQNLESQLSPELINQNTGIENNATLLDNIRNINGEIMRCFKDYYPNEILSGEYCVVYEGELSGNNKSIIEDKLKKLHDLIVKFNTETNYKLPFPQPLSENNYTISTIKNSSIKVIKSTNESISIKFTNANSNFDTKYHGDLIQELNKYIKTPNEEKIFHFYNTYELKNKIDEIANDLKKKSKEVYEEIVDHSNANIEELLEFKPSIRNIFQILMAHLQCFIEIYSEFLKNTQGDTSRTFSRLGISKENTDLNIKSDDNNLILPPFLAFIDKDNNFVYPNGQILRGSIEETNLINALIDGNFSFLQQSTKIEELREEIAVSEDNYGNGEFIPTCLSDIINYYNPYDKVFETDTTIHLDWIMTFFGMRCISNFILEENVRFEAEEFGKLEAYNFWCANKRLGKNIIDKIENSDFNNDNFLHFLSGNINNLPYSIVSRENKSLCYFSNKVKSLIEPNRYANALKYISLSDKFNTPAVIGRRINNDNTTNSEKILDIFHNDTKDDKGIYSFKKNSEKVNIDAVRDNAPTNFIRFIEEKNLNKINSYVNGLDLSEYLKSTEENKDVKKKIVEQYLTPTKGIVGSKSTVYYAEKNKTFNQNLCTRYVNGTDISKELTFSNYKFNFEENFINNDLISISDKITIEDNDELPIFFYNNLQPEDLILTVEHYTNELSNKIIEGRNIITMPYITKLFIGMILNKYHKVNDLNTKTEFSVFLNKINNKLINNKSGITPRVFICKLINIFTRNENGKYIKFTKDNSEEYVIVDKKGIETKINLKNLKNDDVDELLFKDYKPILSNDFLNLGKEYEKWCNNEFKSIIEYYTLTPRSSYTGSSIDALYTIIDNFKANNYKCTSNEEKEEVKGIINNFFELRHGKKFFDLYDSIYSREDKKEIILPFNKNYEGYSLLENLYNKSVKLIIPYSLSVFDEQCKKTTITTAFSSFKEQLLKLYKNTNTETGESTVTDYSQFSSYNVPTDNKLAMYKTLKNLQDKHFHILDEEENVNKFRIKPENNSNVKSEYERFHFVDSFFNDMGHTIMFNLENIDNLLRNLINPNENGIVNSQMSVYSFMAKLCEDNHMMLMAMPVFNGSFTTKEGAEHFEKMFTPLPYCQTINNNSLEGPSYVCFYPNQTSQYLDIPDSQYKNDGFDIVKQDLNGTGSFEGPIDIPDLANSESEYIVPAFAVEYGSQKQSIFKSVNVNMDNPQTTEVAVAIQFGLANRNNETPQKVSFQGQDLFKIYTNYSYTCNVEMMGCAQIQPLMYFQLNNIPMFRGAYTIVKVEHNISPGNMTTSFTGVRVNKNKIPPVKACISSNNMVKLIGNASENSSNVTITPMNIMNLTGDVSRANLMGIDRNITTDDIKNDYGEYIKFDKNGNDQEEQFNNLNPDLRLLIYNLLGDCKELSQKLGYKLGIYLTSSTRTGPVNGNSGSDHLINGKPSKRRTKIKGKDANGVEKLYSHMGCAVDMHAMKDGTINKSEPSVQLFNLIAKNYHEYIRQLIWEVHSSSVVEDKIDVIHLSSYGKNNDKSVIYLGKKSTGFDVHTNKNLLPFQFVNLAKSVIDQPNILKKIRPFIESGENVTQEKINELNTLYNQYSKKNNV